MQTPRYLPIIQCEVHVLYAAATEWQPAVCISFHQAEIIALVNMPCLVNNTTTTQTGTMINIHIKHASLLGQNITATDYVLL